MNKINLLSILFVITGVLTSSCTGNNQASSKTQDEQNDITIEISEKGIFLNSQKISLSTEVNDIKTIIGNPTKEKIQSLTEIQETKEKFGSIPNNIFTWDNYGILVYQKADKKEINSISIDFKGQDFDFSPSTPFSGTLKLNGVKIDKNTSLDELRKISRLEISETIVKVHRASFNNHDLTFEFNSHQDKSGLVGFSIEVNNIPEKANAKGWTDSQIEILKAGTANLEQIKTLSNQYNFEISDFVDCYAEKVTTTLTMNNLENPTPAVQTTITKIMEDCIIQTTKN